MDKNPPGQNLPEKRPSDKPSRTKLREQLREFVQGVLVRIFCTRSTKKSGGPRCEAYFLGVPGCVTKCDRGRGEKLAKNSMMYFMDGPIGYWRAECSKLSESGRANL